MSYPRVLYVGDSQIGYRQSAGFVLESMYASYPSKLITQYARPTPDVPHRGTFVSVRNFAESPIASIVRVGVLGTLLLAKVLRLKAPTHSNTVPSSHSSSMTRIYATLVALADIAPVRLPKKSRRALSRQRPQVIHSLVGDTRSMQRAIMVSEHLDIPIVPFITDDWPSTIYGNGVLGGKARERALKVLARLLERSPVLLVTGEAMAREYSLRFMRQCFVAAPSVDPDDFSTQYQVHPGSRRLVCVGSPHIGRAELADHVAKFAKKRGWEVVVYPVGRKLWQQLTSEVVVEDQLSTKEVSHALSMADAILFVESLDPGIAAYTRLSVSGKLSQIIAAARPILAIGPEGQGSIEELRLGADRKVILHEIEDSSLSEAFDFLETNLDAAPRRIPKKFLEENLRLTFVRALRAANAAWANTDFQH